MAKPRAIMELEKTAKQKTEAQSEEESREELASQKEVEVAKEWELLRQLQEKEMVHSSKDLSKALKAEKKRHAKLAAGQQTKELMKYLKTQRKFLFLVGVPSSVTPILSKKLPGGKQQPYTPDEFCGLLGSVLDKYEAGELEDVLVPIAPLDKKLEKFGVFRDSTMTQQMRDHINVERDRLEVLVEEVKKDVAAGVAAYNTTSKTKKVKKKTASSKVDERLVPGVTVWVADEDDIDIEAGERVWQAIVVGKQTKRGWWRLKFGENTSDEDTYDYVHYNIFFTELEANVNLLMD